MPALLLILLACGPGGRPSATGSTVGSSSQPALPDGVSLRDGPVVRPHKIVEVELPVAAALTLRCTLDSDPEEVITVESATRQARHQVDLLGLAADSTYTCAIEGEGIAPMDFVLEVEPTGAPVFTVERDPGLEMSGVWTLTNTAGGCFERDHAEVIVVDPEGRHRWVYSLGPDLVVDIDASLTPEGWIHMGGGWGLLDEGQPNRGVFRTVTLDGTVVYDRALPDFGLGFNHHSQPMADGTFLGLTTSWMEDATTGWYGVAVERWDPTDGSLPFTWDSTTMWEAGQIAYTGEVNPFHANSVTWMDDAEGPALLLSLYAAREIWRVDRTTGLRTWRFGPGGDFTLLDAAGNPLDDPSWFYVQHDPDWTDDGRVLLYDNGQGRPGGSYSRVAEFQLDPAARTATLRWEWTEPGWYDPVVGDADWLPNGNVLIARGFVVCWTPDGSDTTQIVEVDPRTDAVVWRMRWPDRSESLFRAQRYEGCELFPNNAKYCRR